MTAKYLYADHTIHSSGSCSKTLTEEECEISTREFDESVERQRANATLDALSLECEKRWGEIREENGVGHYAARFDQTPVFKTQSERHYKKRVTWVGWNFGFSRWPIWIPW